MGGVLSPFGAASPLPGSVWQPADDGYLGANFDPAASSGGGLLVGGTLYAARLPVRVATTVTKLWTGVSAVGVGASTGTFVGLCSASGTLLSGSADCAATFTGVTGYQGISLGAAQAVAAGTGPSSWPWAVILCNLATTQVTLTRAFNSVNAVPQAVVSAATLRWGQITAFGTSLGTGFTPSSLVASAFTNILLWN